MQEAAVFTQNSCILQAFITKYTDGHQVVYACEGVYLKVAINGVKTVFK